MTDIATLGYSVDSSGLARATTELDRNTAAAGRTEKATEKLDREFKKANATQLMSGGVSRAVADGMANVTGATGAAGVAVRGLTGALIGLSAPLSAVLLVVGALGMAWKREQDQLFEFDKALAKTSGYAGKTAEELSMLAGAFGRLEGATRKGASEALLKVTESGRFTEQQFMQVSRAAAVMEGSVGQSIDATIDKFEKLADDPVKALIKLNESEHFLTRAQLDRVKAMVEEGREQDAVAEAVRIYSEQLTDVANKSNAAMPAHAKLWRGVKDEINAAQGELGTYLNLLSQVAATKLPSIAGKGGFVEQFVQASLPSTRLGMLNQWYRGRMAGAGIHDFSNVQGTPKDVVDSKAIEAEMEAEKAWGRLTLSNLSKAEKLEKEIADIRKKGAAAKKSEADIEKAIADARARYKESLPKGPKATDPSEGIIERLLKQIAVNEELIESEDKLTASERLLLGVQVELDRLGDKVTPKRRAEIAALMERASATDKAAVAAEKARKAEEALIRLREQTGLAETNQRRANEIGLLGIGRGGDAAEMLRRQLDLHRWYEDQVIDLRRQAAREKREITFGEEQELKDSLQRQLDAERQYQEQRRLAMADWSNGATKAFEDYLYRANDIASQTNEIFSNAFYGLENVITDFLHKGSADWKGFLDDMNRQILQFIVRQQLSKWMESLMGGEGSAGGGSGWQGAVGNFLGSLFGGGRDSGGDLRRDRFYRVGERNRPELANIGGQQYLIPGDRGRVEPIRGGRSERPVVNSPVTVMVQGRIDNRSAARIAQENAVKMRTAMARAGGGG